MQYVSRTWNTLLTSLLRLAEKLEAQGFTYLNGAVQLIADAEGIMFRVEKVNAKNY